MDDYTNDDDGPDPKFASAPNGDDKSTGYHGTIEEEYPTDNTGVEVKNETQSNSENEDEASQDKDGYSESISEYWNNQSENEQ